MHEIIHVSGKLVDIINRRIYGARLSVQHGKIIHIEETDGYEDQYLLPGFIDAHVHIESSMLLPSAFAQVAVLHGTVATVSDPHEIANVCGVEGVAYMLDNSRQTNFKCFFGAPSCVPATFFETAGAVINADTVSSLLQQPDIYYLAEMMNYPGVLHKDEEVLGKIAAAKAAGKPVDGHAPGLKGNDAALYAAAGISTDHECFTLQEALDKIQAGMHIIIREGSAAKNFEALHTIISTYPDKVMFCSDDKHPDELVLHHINGLVKRGVAKGHDLFDVLQAACINPVRHYNIPVGQLRTGDAADFIAVKDLHNFEVLRTWINGRLVADRGKSLLSSVVAAPINNFCAERRTPSDFKVQAAADNVDVKVIEAVEGQLVTNALIMPATVVDGEIVSDTSRDILKIAVVNRFEPHAPVAVAFIKNFGLSHGAIASTVAHDCHNIIAVGVADADICTVVNILVDCKGGIAVTSGQHTDVLPLPIAGLMSDADAATVAVQYAALDAAAKNLGSKLHAPFMTLSFMALLVIPSLKLSDKGLFDGSSFAFTPLQITQ